MDFHTALTTIESLRPAHPLPALPARFRRLMRAMGHPFNRYATVHVTGTKGKGSTTAFTAAVLQAHGLKVGGYYSPYVYDVRERIRIDGSLIEEQAFADGIEKILPYVVEYGPITEFELKTALGFQCFADSAVDAAVVEVGIGGRLDPTNVVTPLVSVITNVGLDHTALLGATHAEIAFEKAGIIKPGVPVITAASHPDALRIIRRQAATRGAPVLQVQEAETPLDDAVTIVPTEDSFSVHTPAGVFSNLTLGMQGEFQRWNAACAVAAAEASLARMAIPMREPAVRQGLASAWLPARMERILERPMVLSDGAHNGMAAEALAREIAAIPHRRLHLIVGMVAGHPPNEFLPPFLPLASRVTAVQPTWHRGVPAERVADAAESLGFPEVVIERDVNLAVSSAVYNAAEEDLILLTGSFYTAGELDRRRIASMGKPAPLPG
jgi:dihydrofolate synthase/folylpolyglutamate synthase